MDFRFTPEQEKWRQEVRSFLQQEIPEDWIEEDAYEPETCDENVAFTAQFTKKMAKKGWIGMHWPLPYGKALPVMEQAVFQDEWSYHHAPVATQMTALGVGACLLAFGTEEQQKKWIPPIIRGEHSYSYDMTESEAGSDLANLSMRGVQDGNDWVLNGVKIFNQYGHRNNMDVVSVRTDTTAKKHRGISYFILDRKTPGMSLRPMWTWYGARINELWYDDVRVPNEQMIGAPNQAWYQGMSNVKFTGVAGSVSGSKRDLDKLVEFCQETKRNGGSLSKDPAIQNTLAQFAIDIAAAQATWWREVCERARREEKAEIESYGTGGGIQPIAGQGNITWRKEWRPEFFKKALEIVGMGGQLRRGAKWAPMAGYFQWSYRHSIGMSHSHGTPEITRLVLATAGLGMPRR